MNQVQAIDNYDHNEQVNGQVRYLQFIQGRLPDGRVFEMDYDRHLDQAVVVEHLENDQAIAHRVNPEVRGKDLIRNFYGIRRFKLRNVWRLHPRRANDPRLMDLTFPEMFQRYALLQFEIEHAH